MKALCAAHASSRSEHVQELAAVMTARAAAQHVAYVLALAAAAEGLGSPHGKARRRRAADATRDARPLMREGFKRSAF